MTEQDIVALVNSIFVESFEIPMEQLRPDANLFQDLGLDSLDAVDLIVAVQQKFGVKIRADERIRSIRTLQSLYDLILTIRKEQESQR